MFCAESNSKAVLSSCQNIQPWSLSPYCKADKIFSVSFSLSQLVARWRDGRGRPHVRASNEGLLRPRVPRAQRSPLRPARLTRLHLAATFQFLFLPHSQAGREEQPSTARVQRGSSETARCASKEGSPHCQPLTSYPFSIKQRTTASPYGGSGSSGL